MQVMEFQAAVDDQCRHDYPPAFSVGEGHTADCWRLEKEWTPRPFSASKA